MSKTNTPSPQPKLMGLSSDEAHLLIRVLKAKIKDDNSKHFNGKLWGHEIVDLAAMERLIERIETETCLWDCADAPMDVCPTFGKPCPPKSSPSPQTNVAALDAHSQSLLAAQNNVIDGLMAENEQLFEALRLLELANDNVCGVRPQKVYDAMISAGMSDRMTELDEARRIARSTLADAGRAALATTEGKDNG